MIFKFNYTSLKMVKEKCFICKNELKVGFMNKILGTIVKKDNKTFFVCQNCQKEFKDNLMDKLK